VCQAGANCGSVNSAVTAMVDKIFGARLVAQADSADGAKGLVMGPPVPENLVAKGAQPSSEAVANSVKAVDRRPSVQPVVRDSSYGSPAFGAKLNALDDAVKTGRPSDELLAQALQERLPFSKHMAQGEVQALDVPLFQDSLTEIWGVSYPRGKANGPLYHIRLRADAEAVMRQNPEAFTKASGWTPLGTRINDRNRGLMDFLHVSKAEHPLAGSFYATRPSPTLFNALGEEFTTLARGDAAIHLKGIVSGADTQTQMAEYFSKYGAIGFPDPARNTPYAPTGLGSNLAGKGSSLQKTIEVETLADGRKVVKGYDKGLEFHDGDEFLSALTISQRTHSTRKIDDAHIHEAWSAIRKEDGEGYRTARVFDLEGTDLQKTKAGITAQRKDLEGIRMQAFGGKADEAYRKEIRAWAQEIWDASQAAQKKARATMPANLTPEQEAKYLRSSSWSAAGDRGIFVDKSGKVIGLAESRYVELEMYVLERRWHSGFHTHGFLADHPGGLSAFERVSQYGPMYERENLLHMAGLGYRTVAVEPPPVSALIRKTVTSATDMSGLNMEKARRSLFLGTREQMQKIGHFVQSPGAKDALRRYEAARPAFTETQIKAFAKEEIDIHNRVLGRGASLEALSGRPAAEIAKALPGKSSDISRASSTRVTADTPYALRMRQLLGGSQESFERTTQKSLFDKEKWFREKQGVFTAIDSEAENAKFKRLAENANRGEPSPVKRSVLIESAVTKELNDSVVKDKDLVTALLNTQKDVLWTAIERDPLLSKHIIGKYTDFKSMKFAFDSADPALERQLKAVFSDVNRRYAEFVQSEAAKKGWDAEARGLAAKVANWHHMGIGASPDEANWAARKSRELLDKNGLSSPRSFSEVRAQAAADIESIRGLRESLSARLGQVNGMFAAEGGRKVLSSEAIEAIRKAKGATPGDAALGEAVKKALEARFARAFSVAEVADLRAYVAKADALSPDLYLDKRVVIPLGARRNGIVSADFKGQNARNLEETMKALARTEGQPLARQMQEIRRGEEIATKALDQKKADFLAAVTRVDPEAREFVFFSGDDGIFLPSRSLSDVEKRSLAAATADQDLRLTYNWSKYADSLELIPEERLSKYIGEAEELEKDLRKEMINFFPRENLNRAQLAIDMTPHSSGARKVGVMIGGDLTPEQAKGMKGWVEGFLAKRQLTADFVETLPRASSTNVASNANHVRMNASDPDFRLSQWAIGLDYAKKAMLKYWTVPKVNSFEELKVALKSVTSNPIPAVRGPDIWGSGKSVIYITDSHHRAWQADFLLNGNGKYNHIADSAKRQPAIYNDLPEQLKSIMTPEQHASLIGNPEYRLTLNVEKTYNTEAELLTGLVRRQKGLPHEFGETTPFKAAVEKIRRGGETYHPNREVIQALKHGFRHMAPTFAKVKNDPVRSAIGTLFDSFKTSYKGKDGTMNAPFVDYSEFLLARHSSMRSGVEALNITSENFDSPAVQEGLKKLFLDTPQGQNALRALAKEGEGFVEWNETALQQALAARKTELSNPGVEVLEARLKQVNKDRLELAAKKDPTRTQELDRLEAESKDLESNIAKIREPEIRAAVAQFRDDLKNPIRLSDAEVADLKAMARSADFTPERFLEKLANSSDPRLKKWYSDAADSGTERGPVRKHTTEVMKNYESLKAQFGLSQVKLPGQSSPDEFMRTFLAIHDIAKSEAVAIHAKAAQHEFIGPAVDAILTRMGYSPELRALAQSMVHNEALGNMLVANTLKRSPENLKDAEKTFRDSHAALAKSGVNIGLGDYAKLVSAFYHADAGSYPNLVYKVFAGGVKRGDQLVELRVADGMYGELMQKLGARASATTVAPIANPAPLAAGSKVRGAAIVTPSHPQFANPKVSAAVKYREAAEQEIADARREAIRKLMAGRGSIDEYNRVAGQHPHFEAPIELSTNEARLAELLRREEKYLARQVAEIRIEQAANPKGVKPGLLDQMEAMHAAVAAQAAGVAQVRPKASIAQRMRDAIRSFSSDSSMARHQHEFSGKKLGDVAGGAAAGALRSIRDKEVLESASYAGEARAATVGWIERKLAGGDQARARDMADHLVSLHAKRTDGANPADFLVKRGWSKMQANACLNPGGLCNPVLPVRSPQDRVGQVSSLARQVLYRDELAKPAGEGADLARSVARPADRLAEGDVLKSAEARIVSEVKALEKEIKAHSANPAFAGQVADVRKAKGILDNELKTVQAERKLLADLKPSSPDAALKEAQLDNLKVNGLMEVLADSDEATLAARLKAINVSFKRAGEEKGFEQFAMKGKGINKGDDRLAVFQRMTDWLDEADEATAVMVNDLLSKELSKRKGFERIRLGANSEKEIAALLRTRALSRATGVTDPKLSAAVQAKAGISEERASLFRVSGANRDKAKSTIEILAEGNARARAVEKEAIEVMAKQETKALPGRALASNEAPKPRILGKADTQEIARIAREQIDAYVKETGTKAFSEAKVLDALVEAAKVVELDSTEDAVRLSMKRIAAFANDPDMFDTHRLIYGEMANVLGKNSKLSRDAALRQATRNFLLDEKKVYNTGFSPAMIDGAPPEPKPGLLNRTLACLKL
jgi:hypothetical protein